MSIPIEQNKQLLVEGKDAQHFANILIKDLGLTDIQVQDFGGISELKGFLKIFVSLSEFKKGLVSSLGIIRDAEVNSNSAFQSVCSSLRNAGLPDPPGHNVPIITPIRINVFILPDGNNAGMLETLCLQSVDDDPVMSCIDEYLHCIELQARETPKIIEKARLLAFLASRSQPANTIGVATKKGYFPIGSPVFDGLKQFLVDL